ncbi:hypothetical protein CEXT_718631 [Caerostris extrusa]|uniref:Uncharacterized protein n=1 Tax=Caerostris extrusa TaxID=172846 RepID=A0AAV4USR9_CAEEX|nr:hypothetical protein CEXT_718631 [Caerostris extrusa]
MPQTFKPLITNDQTPHYHGFLCEYKQTTMDTTTTGRGKKKEKFKLYTTLDGHTQKPENKISRRALEDEIPELVG